jgi:translocation and assembly module TamB
MTSTDRTRPRRRWRIALLAAVIAGAGLFAALPQLLSWTVAPEILKARAGRFLAPSSLEAATVHLSWFGPTEIDRPVLRDERGTRLIVAPRAVVDWNLWQILFDPPGAATLELPRAELEIERRPDGRIDLYETLKPIIRDEPDIRLIVAITGGRLRFRDAVLAEPFLAEPADIRLDIPPNPGPVEFDLSFRSHADGGRETGQIAF